MKELIPASIYVLLVVFVEIGLFYLADRVEFIGNYGMLLQAFLFVAIAWVLKLGIVAAISAVLMVFLYGVLSFYSGFPIYYIGYPDSLMDFMPFIGTKVAFYAFPLIAYIVISKK